MRILIIDDEPIVREVMVDFFDILGHKADGSENGLSGLEKLKNNQYDAVFTDIRMPGIDGIGFLRQAKALHPSMPVIVITGHGSEEVEKEAMDAGASGFINKPIGFSDIRKILEKLL
jgi:DNA-binding NtrC family response regulator